VNEQVKKGIQYDFNERKIFPLFKAITPGLDKLYLPQSPLWYKNLFLANAKYFIHGDDSLYLQLLAAGGQQKNNNNNIQAFENFKQKYDSFVIGDMRWTDSNYSYMVDNAPQFREWWKAIQPLALEAGVELSSICDEIQRLEIKDSDSVFNIVFEDMWSTMHEVLFGVEPTLLPSTTVFKKAFLRWIMFQMLIFEKFISHPHSYFMKYRLLRFLYRNLESLTYDKIKLVRSSFELYLDILHKDRYISEEQMRFYSEIFPYFPVHYIKYDKKLKETPRDVCARILYSA